MYKEPGSFSYLAWESVGGLADFVHTVQSTPTRRIDRLGLIVRGPAKAGRLWTDTDAPKVHPPCALGLKATN